MPQIKSKMELFYLLLSLAPSVASTIWIIIAVPKFDELFNGFGSEMPLATRMLANFYPLTTLVPILVFLMWKYWPFQKYRSFSTIITGAFVGLVAHYFYVWVLYLPILKFGEIYP